MIRSRLAGAVVAATIGALPALPPEHVHEAEDHGPRQFVIHRHAQPHEAAPHDHGATLDHGDDAPVLTLDVVYTAPGAPRVFVSVVPLAATVVDPVDVTAATRRAPYVERLIHGPPRAPASPRAPPPSAFL